MTQIRIRIDIRYNHKDRRELHLQFIIHLVGHGDFSDFRLEHIIDSLFALVSDNYPPFALVVMNLTEK